MELQRPKQGLKGNLSIDAEIFEVTSSLFMVELHKINNRGDMKIGTEQINVLWGELLKRSSSIYRIKIQP